MGIGLQCGMMKLLRGMAVHLEQLAGGGCDTISGFGGMVAACGQVFGS